MAKKQSGITKFVKAIRNTALKSNTKNAEYKRQKRKSK